jgi:hypothetical protein
VRGSRTSEMSSCGSLVYPPVYTQHHLLLGCALLPYAVWPEGGVRALPPPPVTSLPAGIMMSLAQQSGFLSMHLKLPGGGTPLGFVTARP